MLFNIRTFAACRLGRRVALAVFVALLVIEGLILVPSAMKFRDDLYGDKSRVAVAAIHSAVPPFTGDLSGQDILSALEKNVFEPTVKGVALYDSSGALHGFIGEKPKTALTPDVMSIMHPLDDGARYEFSNEMSRDDRSWTMVIRIDSSSVRMEVVAYVLRIIGLVALIAAGITIAAMVIVNWLVLGPVLAVRAALARAAADPANADAFVLPENQRDEIGDVVGALNTVFREVSGNIRRIRESEQALRATKEKVEEASRAKSDFLASMSHELRTPLNAILGMSELIVSEAMGPITDKAAGEKYKDYAGDVHASGAHLLELINDILDLSKAESGKIELFPEPTEIHPLLHASLNMVRERAQGDGIELVCALPRENGPVLDIDARRIRQTVINLLSNAVKFTPQGGTVTVSLAEPPDGGIEIRITDTGVGIVAEDIDKVFQAFEQTGRDIEKKVEGTGLGLPLSRVFMELHGGTLNLESVPGQGTTARAWFPPSRRSA